MGNKWTWKQIFAFLLIFFPSLIFYALQKKTFVFLADTPFKSTAHRFQEFYDSFTHKIQSNFKDYLYLVKTNRENRELKLKIKKLKSELQLLEEDRLENKQLRKLFEFREKIPKKTLAARVIAKDILNWESFVINKGSFHGIQRLQGVISPQGVVGYILEVKAHTSQVLLLSNRETHIDAIIQRTRARGLVSGFSPNACRFNYMIRKDDAKNGDKVVTSGQHGFFPKGFPIGTIKNIKPSPTGVSYLAEVEPSVKTDRLENVLVVINEKNITENHKKPAGNDEDRKK